MRISDWSSDVCSSDLPVGIGPIVEIEGMIIAGGAARCGRASAIVEIYHRDPGIIMGILNIGSHAVVGGEAEWHRAQILPRIGGDDKVETDRETVRQPGRPAERSAARRGGKEGG